MVKIQEADIANATDAGGPPPGLEGENLGELGGEESPSPDIGGRGATTDQTEAADGGSVPAALVEEIESVEHSEDIELDPADEIVAAPSDAGACDPDLVAGIEDAYDDEPIG